MDWQKVKIPATEVARANRIENDFHVIWQFGAKESAALFGNRDSDDDFSFYFSPEAARLFEARLPGLGAHACEPPPKDAVRLVSGHASAWDMLA